MFVLVFLHTFRGRGGIIVVVLDIFCNKCLLCFVICIVQTWGSINYIVFVVVPTITKPQKGFQWSAVVNTKICSRWHVTQHDKTFLLQIQIVYCFSSIILFHLQKCMCTNKIRHTKHIFEIYFIKTNIFCYFCINLGVGLALLSLCSIFFSKCLYVLLFVLFRHEEARNI